MTRRAPVPEPRLLAATVAVACLLLLAPLWPPLLGVGLGLGLLLALLTLADALFRPPAGAVRVERSLGSYHVGRAGSWELFLANRTDQALRVVLREVLPAELEGEGARLERVLSPGGAARLTIEFVALARGTFRLLPLGLRVSRPWGLLAWQEWPDPEDRAAVLPGRPAGEGQWLLQRATLLDHGQRRQRRLGADWEFESLREYVPGDEVRRIDWKSSARRSKPLTRQYEAERRTELILALDCGRLMGTLVDGVTKLDLALTPVLDLAAVALQRGERVGFLAFDREPRAFLPPRPGLSQLHEIRRAAAALPPPVEPTSYLRAAAHLDSRHKKRCLLVLFSDFTDEVSASELLASVVALSRRHALIFVAVGDAHLDEILEAEERATRAPFQQAVAGQLLLERQRALRRLERLGIPTLDAEPKRLSGPLIRKYVETRMQGVG